ncbi:MAG: succinyl-diaminopimelate desuccinylase, partial [Burkholderiaceae bacterium]
MGSSSRTLQLTEALISRRSVTPADGGCQELIEARLKPLGFDCVTLPCGPVGAQVVNLWALRRGSSAAGKLLVFAGHTDVVPTGPLEQWRSDPFVPTHRDG